MSGGQSSASTDVPNQWLPYSQIQVGLREIEMLSRNPGRLRMLLYVPPHIRPLAPLVVVLHAGWQNAHDYADGAGWLTLANRFGFAVLCPEQSFFNNASRSFNWFEPPDISRKGGEADSIYQMVVLAVALHNLDVRRVFITGLSAGGAMAAVMLATYPDVFAGGAVIAGLPYGAAENVWGALAAMAQSDTRSDQELGDKVRAASSNFKHWPTISIWHGDRDTTVAPSASDDLVRQWRDVHGLTCFPVDAQSADGRRYQIWLSANGDRQVEHHRIAGMSHGVPLRTTAPDGCGRPGPYLIEMDISSSHEIAQSWGVAVYHAEMKRPHGTKSKPLAPGSTA
jgi:poly(hydroxyalkanoate) depolymerase family esterase